MVIGLPTVTAPRVDQRRMELKSRAARSGLWASATTVEELVDDADERLFSKVRHCAHHILEELLPPASDSQHNLRKRRHNVSLPEKKGHLAAKNFIIGLLYKDIY